MSRMPLAVIRGLTYFDLPQVFNRWLIPTYQMAFRWTGNRVDTEDATAWAFVEVASHIRLPELVQVVDDHVVDAAVEAIHAHWTHRYGVDIARRSEIQASGSGLTQRPTSLDALFADLSPEMRLVLVLRFLRQRRLPAIAAQLGIRLDVARVLMIAALVGVAQKIGIQGGSGPLAQVDHVCAYVDDIIGKRKPIRFEMRSEALAAVIGANHVQAAIAGNSLPEPRFVRSLERRLVTSLRIWSA